jgi:vitamin B12 transporter
MKNTFAILSLLAAFFVPALSFNAAPQSQTNKPTLTGTLTDPSGAPVSDAQVVAYLDSSSAESAKTVSAADGSYSLSLPPGRYRLRFSRDSFAPRDLTVTLVPGESRVLNVHMNIEPVSSSVVVTAQSLPSQPQQTTAPTEIISRETISDRQASSLPELLQFSTGINTSRTGAFGGTTSVFINGGNSDFTKVLVDGAPLNPPGSAVDFSSLTTENIDKVEIVRGAESALYGSDAVSGVIQVFTHRGETRIPAFTAYSEGGNFSSTRTGGDLSGMVGGFDYSAAAEYFQTDGQGPNDSFINRTLSGNFGYTFADDNRVRLSLRNNTSDAGIPGQTLFAPPSLYQQYAQQIFSAIGTWDFSIGKHWQNEISTSEMYTSQHSFNPQQAYYATDPNAFCPQTNPAAVATSEMCDFTYDSLLTFNTVNIQAQTSYVTRKFIGTAGYLYQIENGGNNSITPGHLRRNNQAGFLDLRYMPIPRLSLDFGGRVEDNSSYGTRFVPRIGGTYALHYGKGFFGDTLYRAFYGQGIKEPRFDQTFGTDPCYPGNPDLKPESSKNFSTGFDQHLDSDRLRVSADYFYTTFYNIISFGYYPPPNPDFCGSYFNTDRAVARGVNLSSQFQFRKWLFLNGNYTYDDSRVLQSPNTFDPALIQGNHLIRRPVNSGSFGVNFNYARFNWNFISYFSGARNDSNFIDPTQHTNPGYARFDLAASYNFVRGLYVTARVLNLFDKQYQDALGYPAFGRYYMVGLRYNFFGKS